MTERASTRLLSAVLQATDRPSQDDFRPSGRAEVKANSHVSALASSIRTVTRLKQPTAGDGGLRGLKFRRHALDVGLHPRGGSTLQKRTIPSLRKRVTLLPATARLACLPNS